MYLDFIGDRIHPELLRPGNVKLSAADQHNSSDSKQIERQIAEARNGSAAAANELLTAFRDYLLLVANQELAASVRPKVAPSDVVQDSLLLAHQRFDQFRGNTEQELFAWLRQILVSQMANANRDLHREKRNIARERPVRSGSGSRPVFEPADQANTPATQARLHEEAQQLRQAMAVLSEDAQQAVMLRNWERMTFAEIGKRLGRSEDAARKLWFRSIQKLRNELDGLDVSI